MSKNKRPVSTDALETLGMLIDEKQKRDAIHLAVEPVIAGERMNPGEHVIVKNGVAWPASPGNGLGIVDPFLVLPVKKGQRFWFIMYPRQVTSLRHVWSHPEFHDEAVVETAPRAERNASELWIVRYADSLRVDYQDLMESARDWVSSGSYMNRGGVLQGEVTSPEFWHHFEKVAGVSVSEDRRGNFFTCEC